MYRTAPSEEGPPPPQKKKKKKTERDPNLENYPCMFDVFFLCLGVGDVVHPASLPGGGGSQALKPKPQSPKPESLNPIPRNSKP